MPPWTPAGQVLDTGAGWWAIGAGNAGGGRGRLCRGGDILLPALVKHPRSLGPCGLQVATRVGVREVFRFVAQGR